MSLSVSIKRCHASQSSLLNQTLSCFEAQLTKRRAISTRTPCLQPNNRREEDITAGTSLPCHEKERIICSKRKEAYQDVLSIILDEPNLTLKDVRVEQVNLNKSGKRAIRLDAWAQDTGSRQFDMEMQNDSSGDDIRRRVIIFITQEDIFGKDLAMYTFREWCQELPNLPLDDGTSKIFLNMTSKKGRAELVSLLQYMKNSTLNNSEI